MKVRLRFLPSEVNEMVKVPRGGFLSNDGMMALQQFLSLSCINSNSKYLFAPQDEGEAAVLPQCA